MAHAHIGYACVSVEAREGIRHPAVSLSTVLR